MEFFDWFAQAFNTLWELLKEVPIWFADFCLLLLELLTNVLTVVFKWAIYIAMYLSYVAMLAASEVANEILQALDISGHLERAYGHLNVEVSQMLTFLRIPECFNIILSSLATRFTMRFAPAFGAAS
ncbi:DUF2523 family protein [Zooshikella ganghwensis]|uniref:DUF2523 family protein n=1 Tax=Zooshikella ganghwensis TaxID=202772 RepID=UPI0003FD766D|nr:DUF2523 family protein [Zooshikella ganghwensis]